MRRRAPLLLTVAVVIALVTSACREGSVQLTYAPREGARSTYRIEVEARAVTTIGDEPARETVETAELTAEHTVLSASPEGSRVEVRLSAPGIASRTLIVRLDRGAQVAEVQRIEGLPARALGSLGLSELFPVAATAPPRRRLGPGDRWQISELVDLGGRRPVRLRGVGRLVSLDVIDGRDVATVETAFRLAVERTTSDENGRLRLDGEQHTEVEATHRLADGSIESAKATTTGTFDVMLLPPPGESGPPVPGDLRLTVRSTTTRLR